MRYAPLTCAKCAAPVDQEGRYEPEYSRRRLVATNKILLAALVPLARIADAMTAPGRIPAGEVGLWTLSNNKDPNLRLTLQHAIDARAAIAKATKGGTP